jgi:3-methyladenine DNA glycosylase AlkD
MGNDLNELNKDFRLLSDSKKSKILQRFFKTGKGQYGEGDKFLGIVVPKQRMLAKKYQALSFGDLEKLIRSPFHEERLVSLLILTNKFQITNDKLQKKEIFNFYLKHTKYINNWDLVDLTAPKIVGAYLMDKDRSILYRMVKSKNLWERRIAVLATFQFIYFRDPTDTLKLAKLLLADSHDLIHKAVGWMLREVGKRCGEKHLRTFLDKNATTMPRTMLRYAIERLDEKNRTHYLHLKKEAD